MQVVFTPCAVRQIDELHGYVADHSFEDRADTYVARLIEFCEGLRQFPERGTPRDDILPGLRPTVYARRVTVAYLLDGDTVLIEGIYAQGRDYEQDFQ